MKRLRSRNAVEDEGEEEVGMRTRRMGGAPGATCGTGPSRGQFESHLLRVCDAVARAVSCERRRGRTTMQRRRAETQAAARSAGLCAVALSCGDIGDAQLPLPVYGAGSREVPAELELTPSPFAAVPAQAVASLRVSAAAGGACPIEFEAMLPDTSARQTFVYGVGARA